MGAGSRWWFDECRERTFTEPPGCIEPVSYTHLEALTLCFQTTYLEPGIPSSLFPKKELANLIDPGKMCIRDSLNVIADNAVIDVHIALVIEHIEGAVYIDFKGRGDILVFLFLL